MMTSDKILIIFSQRMQELRLSKGINQKTLSANLHLTYTTLWNYENGKKFPRLSDLVSIADYFNISIDYLLGRTNNPAIKK